MKKIITEVVIYLERLEKEVVVTITGSRSNNDVNLGEEYLQIDRLGFPVGYSERSFTEEEMDQIEESAYEVLYNEGEENDQDNS